MYDIAPPSVYRAGTSAIAACSWSLIVYKGTWVIALGVASLSEANLVGMIGRLSSKDSKSKIRYSKVPV